MRKSFRRVSLPSGPLRPCINGFALVGRLEYALRREDGEGDAGLEDEGFDGVGDIMWKLGEYVGTLTSWGERGEERSGEDESGDETRGV